MANLTGRGPVQKGVRTPRKAREGTDKAHLAFVRSLPCLACGGASEAHHLLVVPNHERGGAMKSGDRWAVPLCHDHHMSLHDWPGGERDWFNVCKIIYPPAIAALLFQLSGNTDAAMLALSEARTGG